jgi:hypothetical protein
MPTSTHDRFAPRGELRPEQLRAYVEGRLNAAERHQVELHLEHDPLAREAADGLREAGAMAGLGALHAARPAGAPAWPWLAGAAVVLISGALWWTFSGTPEQVAHTDTTTHTTTLQTIPESSEADETTALQPAEIEAAVEIPETLYIGHTTTDLHARAATIAEAAVEREPITVERLEGIPPVLDTTVEPSVPASVRSKRNSIQLLFLHDLKVVDPRELYRVDPLLMSDERHVNANFADGEQQRNGQEPQRFSKYTPYMDVTLGKFVRNQHKACLEDLRFLLQQYPNDVNALFYAGLCSYNLGMNDRARSFFHRAATHPVQVFNEEAVWYHALTLSRLGEHTAATEAYQRIAAQDGFYAERARERLQAGGK